MVLALGFRVSGLGGLQTFGVGWLWVEGYGVQGLGWSF